MAFDIALPQDPHVARWKSIYYQYTQDPLAKVFLSTQPDLPHHGRPSSLKLFLNNIGQRLPNLFEFVVVRHPYTRVASYSQYSEVVTRYSKEEVTYDVDKVLDLIEDGNDLFYASQLKWIENPVNTKVSFYKLEELSSGGWLEIQNKLKIDLPPLKKINISTKQVELTKLQKERCYSICKEEFTEFNYSRL